ncbi:MAG TPA: ROK family protein [Ktedonobacteraceae bacterium]
MSADESTEKQQPLPTIGIDLGGTQIRAAVLRGAQICARAWRLTGEDPTPERVLPRIHVTVEEVLAQAQIALRDVVGVGVAAPGPLDNRTGTLYAPPNLLSWHAVPLKDLLTEAYQAPVFVEHDANAAALGEYLFGAGQGCQEMVYLTVSTGIGGGVITNGRLLEGVNGTASELGHLTIDWQGERCACGNVGCLEALASGRAIARQANEAIARGQGAELLAFARTMLEHTTTVPDKGALPQQDFSTRPLDPAAAAAEDGPQETEVKVTSQTVARAAEAGIPLARAIITRAAEALGVGLVNILHIFSPQVVILGGGVMQMGSMLLEPALSIVQERTMRANLAGARIVQAQLGENAGLIGAGALPLSARP